MKTIRFLTTCVVKDYRAGTPDEERYAAGQVVTLSDASAAHWLSRKKAEECEPEPEVLPAAPSPAPLPAALAEPLPVGEADDAPAEDSRTLRRGKTRKEPES